MNKLEYQPGTSGQAAIPMDGPSAFVGTAEELRSRKWDYELGYRDLMNAVRPAREVSVNFASDYEIANALRRVADADVAAGTPGTFVAQGEWRQRGYILEANHDSIHFGRLSTDLTVALLDGAWWRVVQKSFFPDVPQPTPAPKEYRTQRGKEINVLNANDLFHELDGEGYAKQKATTGKNLLDAAETFSKEKTTYYGCVIDNIGGGGYTLSGTNSGNSFNFRSKEGSVTIPAGTYTLSANGDLVGCYVQIWIGGTIYAAQQGATTFTLESESTITQWSIWVSSYATISGTCWPMLEAGSAATSYEPYTGGKSSPSPDYPQEIEVVRRRNLLNAEQSYTETADNAYYADFISLSGAHRQIGAVELEAGVTYTLTADVESTVDKFTVSVGVGNGTYAADIASVSNLSNGRIRITFTPTEAKLAQYGNLLAFRIPRYGVATTFTFTVSNIQLERGSTPTPYVPYGHVGLEVRDSSDELVSVTPIPLPAKGFAAALPDGTADKLTIDSAGHVEWTSRTNMVTFDGGEAWARASSAPNNMYIRSTTADSGFDDVKIAESQYNPNAIKLMCDRFGFKGRYAAYKDQYGLTISGTATATDFCFDWRDVAETMTVDEWKTWLASHNLTVLYPLETPQTADLGYIQLPEFPDGATISIPELDEIAVTWEVVPGVNLDYPYDYQYDYSEASTTPDIETSVLTQSAVRFVVFGPAVNPAVTVGDNAYQVNVEVPVGGYLTVDGREKTIMLTLADGSTQNAFEYGVRGSGLGSGNYIFEPVKPGLQAVSWDGSFGFDFGWYEEEGEPPWSLS